MPKKRDMNAPYWVQLREAERRIIEYALEHGGSLRGTAAILGISSNYLSERTRELGIPAPEVRPGPRPGTKRPNLRVVSPDDVPDDANGGATLTPTPPKPPRRPTASSDDTLDEDDDEDEEDWEAGEGDDEDDDEDEDEDDDEADEDDVEPDASNANGEDDAEDASQGGN